ncbi:Serine/threonine-protein phosphatase [Entamoeba marina]
METHPEQHLSFDQIEEIIQRLMKIPNSFPKESLLKRDEVISLCKDVIPIFKKETTLLEVESPINIIGDIHGQFTDLLRLLTAVDFSNEKYLFLGNYIDRGSRGIEVLCLLYALKIHFPNRFYFLRGNHESENINRLYGFYDECKLRYDETVWKEFNNTFDMMPLAAVVNKKIFCVHSGISPQLMTLSQIADIQRPLKLPLEGMLCDLVWSVPGNSFGWKPNNIKNISIIYGEDVCKEFMSRNRLDMICRGSVSTEPFTFTHSNKVVTISSALNCCSNQNGCCIMVVQKDLKYSFIVFKQKE